MVALSNSTINYQLPPYPFVIQVNSFMAALFVNDVAVIICRNPFVIQVNSFVKILIENTN